MSATRYGDNKSTAYTKLYESYKSYMNEARHQMAVSENASNNMNTTFTTTTNIPAGEPYQWYETYTMPGTYEHPVNPFAPVMPAAPTLEETARLHRLKELEDRVAVLVDKIEKLEKEQKETIQKPYGRELDV